MHGAEKSFCKSIICYGISIFHGSETRVDMMSLNLCRKRIHGPIILMITIAIIIIKNLHSALSLAVTGASQFKIYSSSQGKTRKETGGS